eukprot:CAMPEP_0183307666 /NCGR_PEP_ID=MMETSP0160_2-20130417/18660_1 /TAXON_ID=2839 ORGANISM="Odontella Sinensis, Strain Grunow 1884" /NCGR_SAMPLE_ID=MMETSP0160_2 /ASSEMBLY_ACC=CAM_ASM_000250 /LENGTH=337 /DNA_ID=CAMNT_0025471305 /DNA_START=35 /DNA_END=1048 /DNA_ORIENTATION=+
MAINTPKMDERAVAVPQQTSRDAKQLEDGVGGGLEKDSTATYPDAAMTPRVTSDDWIGDYADKPLSAVSFANLFDDQEQGEDSDPLAIDSKDLVPDALFDFLKKIERQGKRIDTLGVLAEKLARSKTDEPSRPPGVIFPHGFSPTGAPRISPQVHLPQASDSPRDNLVAFLRDIEQRYEVLLGERKQTNPFSPEASISAGSTPTATEATTHLSDKEYNTPTPLKVSLVDHADERRSKVYCEPNDKDVLLGRGGLTNHHVGNKRYREEIEQLKPWYNSCKTKTEKKELSQLFMEYVHSYGGRFLEKDETGRWHLAENKRARKKASQALRENKRQKRAH